MAKPQIETEPKPPFPDKKIPKPGIEAELEPRPRYQAPKYKAAGKLEGKVALDHRRRLRHRPRRRGVLRARRRGRRHHGACRPNSVDAEETRRAVEAEGRQVPHARRRPHGSPSSACDVVDRTVAELGRLDILVSNAAHQNRKRVIEDITEEEWDRTFKTNVYAYFRLVKAALPHLSAGASIIVTGSETGLRGAGNAARLLGDQGRDSHASQRRSRSNWRSASIRVNCVAPGPVWTPLNAADEGNPPEKVAEVRREDTAEAPRAARRARAGVRVFRVGRGLELHHGRDPRRDGRGNDSGVATEN